MGRKPSRIEVNLKRDGTGNVSLNGQEVGHMVSGVTIQYQAGNMPVVSLEFIPEKFIGNLEAILEATQAKLPEETYARHQPPARQEQKPL